MKTNPNRLLLPFILLFSPVFLAAPLLAQGTAFTYQGRLSDGPNPADGSYDLRFTVYDSPSAGLIVGGPLTNAHTGASNGLFTVTLDFGSGVFTGPARWLEIGVRANGSAIVSWPTCYGDFSLQQSGDLAAASWQTPPQSVVDDGTNKFIAVTPPVGNRFYRLAQP